MPSSEEVSYQITAIKQRIARYCLIQIMNFLFNIILQLHHWNATQIVTWLMWLSLAPVPHQQVWKKPERSKPVAMIRFACLVRFVILESNYYSMWDIIVSANWNKMFDCIISLKFYCSWLCSVMLHWCSQSPCFERHTHHWSW